MIDIKVDKELREKELNDVIELIKGNYEYGDCGLFDTRNIVGDYMVTIYDGKYLTLDICYNYGYFEVFGTTDKEFKKIEKIYDDLKSKGE